MKKLKSLFAVLAFGGVLLSGCAGKDNTDGEQKGGTSADDTVLVDSSCESFCVFGNNMVVSNGQDVDNDWAAKDFNKMTAISLNQAKALDATLGAELAKKSLKGLYKFEGVVLGTKDAGWTAHRMRNGVDEEVNGSYCVKACGVDKNEEGEYVNSLWCPSAEVHGESLTPSSLFITGNMAEEVVDGYDHNSNPVALEAGVYTVVLATYKTGVGAFNIMCGLGLIKTASRTPFTPAE